MDQSQLLHHSRPCIGQLRDSRESIKANKVEGSHLLKKMGLETKYEKITSGGKVKKIYVAPNKYQIDTLCYTGSYPVEFVDFQVDYTEMFDTLIKPPIEAVYEAIGWRLPDVINETEVDLFTFFS